MDRGPPATFPNPSLNTPTFLPTNLVSRFLGAAGSTGTQSQQHTREISTNHQDPPARPCHASQGDQPASPKHRTPLSYLTPPGPSLPQPFPFRTAASEGVFSNADTQPLRPPGPVSVLWEGRAGPAGPAQIPSSYLAIPVLGSLCPGREFQH